MAIEKNESFVIVKHPSGASVKILKYGATHVDLTSDPFNDSAARLDGTKAVRGGIPLVFPVFGKSSNHPTASLPQHGFARISTWRLTSETETSVKFTLTPNDLDTISRTQWGNDFKLIYTIMLSDSQLTCELEVHNPGNDGFECNTLLHSYLRVNDVSAIGIEGLASLQYVDKVAGKVLHENSETVYISGPTDRVYKAAPPETTVVAHNKPVFTIHRFNFKDVVVWNPYTEGAASMGDFEPKSGWKNMICVEAGNVGDWMTIPAGGAWKGKQVIQAHL